MNCSICIKTYAYVSKRFPWSLQESFYLLGTNRLYHNQSPKIMVLPLQHLLFMFHLVEFHPLRY